MRVSSRTQIIQNYLILLIFSVPVDVFVSDYFVRLLNIRWRIILLSSHPEDFFCARIFIVQHFTDFRSALDFDFSSHSLRIANHTSSTQTFYQRASAVTLEKRLFSIFFAMASF